LDQFSKSLANFRNTVSSCDAFRAELVNRLRYVKEAVLVAQGLSPELLKEVKSIETKLQKLEFEFNGDASLARREFETLPGINGMVEGIVGGLWSVTSQQTGTYEEVLVKAKNKFKPAYNLLKETKKQLEQLESKLDALNAPFTPGRFPEYKD
jgi:hypothetical protein